MKRIILILTPKKGNHQNQLNLNVSARYRNFLSKKPESTSLRISKFYQQLPLRLQLRQHFRDRLPHQRRGWADCNAEFLQHRDFFGGTFSGGGDDRAGVAHAAAFRRGKSGDIGY